ncbi:ABC transporter permease [Halostreptopolyspora alba]
MGRAVANEFAKMRRLRVTPVVFVMVAGVLAVSCVEFTASGFVESMGDPAGKPWQRLLASMSFSVLMLSPILLAVLASRQVDIEHQGNGWLLSRTSGLAPGYLCRVKFVAAGAVVVAATVAQSGLVFAGGALVGITVVFPAGQWLGYTALLVVVNLVLFALHLLLSARVENQLLGMGVGVLGVFFAVISTGLPQWLSHFLPPWGYYELIKPVEYREDGSLVSLAPSYVSVLALGAAGGVLFLLVTRQFDRREV